MSKGNKKKKWARPKLIVLTRGKPEEGVLSLCKGASTAIEPIVRIAACRQGFCFGCYNETNS